MGKSYIYFKNPISDLLIDALIKNYDISKKENIDDIYFHIYDIIESMGFPECNEYIKFKIKKDLIYYKIIPENFITGLVFLGIIPYNCKRAFVANKLEYKNMLYTFNKKTKKIIKKPLKK